MSFHVFRVVSCLSPLSLRMIRWLVTDHSMHDEELKTSHDREILLQGAETDAYGAP
jgi:hypothetical protein